MGDILTNCIITKKDSEVLREYALTANGKEYHTGIDIKAEEVYCPCKGVVVQRCLVDGYQSVIVQYSEHIALRFSHLKESYVQDGQIILDDEKIGLADKFVHFEYLTNADNDPIIRIYIMPGVELYMHDPRLILSGNIQFDHSHIATQYDREEKLSMFEEYVSYLEGEALEEFNNLQEDLTPYILNSDLFEDLA